MPPPSNTNNNTYSMPWPKRKRNFFPAVTQLPIFRITQPRAAPAGMTLMNWKSGFYRSENLIANFCDYPRLTEKSLWAMTPHTASERALHFIRTHSPLASFASPRRGNAAITDDDDDDVRQPCSAAHACEFPCFAYTSRKVQRSWELDFLGEAFQ